jgi:3-deoxy-manno-octulosonate cytidylyltransferase (CMP-KDO synthetase)
LTALAVIPARYASSRFPGKPLVRVGGKPLVEWVYRSTLASGLFDDVVVATDDEAIARCVHEFGGAAELTSDSHETGTDRVAEVASRRPDASVVANIQGDQPLLSQAQLTALLTPYRDGRDPEMSTVACPLEGDPSDPNVVKVVCDEQGRALYFSRSPIPHADVAGAPFLHHLGLYAFRGDFLQTYTALAETELERRERLEQLRALAHGYRITVTVTDESAPEVNTPEDVNLIEQLLAARA